MAHCVEHWLYYTKRERKSYENIGKNDRVCGKHYLNALRIEEAAKRSVRAPKEQQRKPGNGCRDRRWQRDYPDARIAAPEVVFRPHVGREEAKKDIKNRCPKACDYRKF